MGIFHGMSVGALDAPSDLRGLPGKTLSAHWQGEEKTGKEGKQSGGSGMFHGASITCRKTIRFNVPFESRITNEVVLSREKLGTGEESMKKLWKSYR